MPNFFKKAIHRLEADQDETVTQQEKDLMKKEARMYIFIKDLLKKVEPLLEAGESIEGFLPMTNESNSAMGTSGWMGMGYARQKDARSYVNTFHDTRGNRLMIFTDRRMIFLVVLDFLEDGHFFSHPYDSIKGIRFEKHKIGYFDWQAKGWRNKRKHTYWYTFDFQSGNQIFTEMLSPRDAETLERHLRNIPALSAILVDEHVHRNTTFDYIFSNTKVATWVYIVSIILLIALIVLPVLAGMFRGVGIYRNLYLY